MSKFLIVVLFLIVCYQSWSQNYGKIDSTQFLQSVEVNAYQAQEITPVSYLNLNKKTISSLSYGQEPNMVLSGTPSITFYSDAGLNNGYSYIRMRGIDQTRINFTLDGVPINEPEDQGTFFSNYPDILNSVSKIQVQRGVGTTKNGVASYAGSVQLFSPNLRDSMKTRFGIGYGSYNSLRVFGEFNSGIKKNKAFYVRMSELYSDGYKYHSSNHAQSAFLCGAIFMPKSSWRMNLLIGHQQNQLAWLGVADSLIQIDRRNNANKNERDNYMQLLASVKNTLRLGRYSTLNTSVYYTFAGGNYDFNLNTYLGLPETNQLMNYASLSHLIGLFSNYSLIKNNFNFHLGMHGNMYMKQHDGSDNFLGKLYANQGYKNELSVFAKLNYTYNWLICFVDLQYRFTNFRYRGDVFFKPLSWQFFNPKAGLSIRLPQHFVIYYSVGSTGREPTRSDMFGGNDNLLADSLGNALLFNTQAEYVLDHELGFRHQSTKWNMGFNLYYMDFKNEIVLNGNFGPNGMALTSNVKKSYRTGAEFSFTYVFNKHFSLINHSSYNYCKVLEQSIRFTPILSPPLIVNQTVQYTTHGFTVAIIGRYQSKSFMDFANTAQLKDYFLLNARFSYQIKGVCISLFVNNITNTKYYNDGYVDWDGTKKYFVQAPINLYGAIQYSF